MTYVYRFGSTGGGSSSGHSTRYTLHYESNGGTAYKDERYASGTKVTLDKTPTRESYTFTGWYADKALTQKITSVTMNSDKTVYAGWEATGVPDKLNGDDHFAYVIGYPDGKVHPKGNISRAETATIFFRLLKADIRDGNLTADNDFSDVSDGQWHNKAISTMAKLGIVKGRRANRFDPNASTPNPSRTAAASPIFPVTGRKTRSRERRRSAGFRAIRTAHSTPTPASPALKL